MPARRAGVGRGLRWGQRRHARPASSDAGVRGRSGRHRCASADRWAMPIWSSGNSPVWPGHRLLGGPGRTTPGSAATRRSRLVAHRRAGARGRPRRSSVRHRRQAGRRWRRVAARWRSCQRPSDRRWSPRAGDLANSLADFYRTYSHDPSPASASRARVIEVSGVERLPTVRKGWADFGRPSRTGGRALRRRSKLQSCIVPAPQGTE
jgi:hypothetical protein